jgi:hypothetical protein
MSDENGNKEIPIEIVRKFIATGQNVPEALKDELLFGSLVDLYDGQKVIRENVRSLKPWVNIFKWMLLIVGPLVAGLLFGMVTHTFTWPF